MPRKKNAPVPDQGKTLEVVQVQPMPEAKSGLPALANTPDMMMTMAIEKGASIEVLERLSKLMQEWLDRQAVSTFRQAMADFQSEVPVISKNKNVNYETKNNGRVDYNHAELDHIIQIIKPFKKKYNFSHEWKYRHFKDANGAPMIEVTCVVSHPCGHSESTSMEGEHDGSGGKNGIQGRGSTVTYLQRYTLRGAFGLAEAGVDNDGGKMDQETPQQPKKKSTPTPAKPAMSVEQLNKAILRISKGEDIIQECKHQFTLTDKQIKALEDTDAIRMAKGLQNKIDKEVKQ